MKPNKSALHAQHYSYYFPLLIRLVTGWIYFSAFWRRTALANKLDPEAAGYIGEKFNHFLPNALFIKPMIQWLVENPDFLWINMLVFTIIEGVVGLFLIFGLFTRLAGLGATLLAVGILLGAGWLGTTCLDEWQIGVFGIITGSYLFFSGGGAFSLDQRLQFKFPKSVRFWMSSDLAAHFSLRSIRNSVLAFAAVSLFITLGTNQYFHGGVWGNLHNLSKSPKIEISSTEVHEDFVLFEAMRIEGIDTYGSFVIAIHLTDASGEVFYTWDNEELSQLSPNMIDNQYVAKVKIGAHGLEYPLGALASVKLPLDEGIEVQAQSQLVLEDVSGTKWSVEL